MPKPVVNTSPLLPTYEEKTLDQLRMEDLEAKVDRLTELLARSLKAQNPPFAPEYPTREDIERGYELTKKIILEPKRADPKPKKTAARKMPVLTLDQKQRRSDAIKAGMARKRALTESVPAEQP